MASGYVLGGRTFGRKLDIKREISRVLNAGELGSRVDDRDLPFVTDLLWLRPEKVKRIGGRSITGFVRGAQIRPPKRTRCFWAVLSDGERVDFSVYRAVAALEARSGRSDNVQERSSAAALR